MSHEKVALSSAVRNSLLSLQDTSKLIARTEGRLSTGLRVASPVDDPVAFFQAKALSDRAFDFQERKDGIDQGVSTVMAALNGVEAVEHIGQQMKGLTQAMKSATDAQFTDLVRQFNDLRTQINRLTADTTYQGVNLINGTGEILEVEFSEKSDSLLRIESFDLTYRGLGIGAAHVIASGDSILEATINASGVAVNMSDLQANGGIYPTNPYNVTRVSDAGDLRIGVEFTYQGPDDVFTAGGLYEFNNGTAVYQIAAATSVEITQGAVIFMGIVTAYSSLSGGDVAPAGRLNNFRDGFGGDTNGIVTTELGIVIPDAIDPTVFSKEYLAANKGQTNYVTEGDVDSINRALGQMDDALTQLRGDAATLGSNVALLKTRLSFTEDYVNTLEGGAGKLTLADINEEGANLLALQTRQQLGISALAFAGQAEQSILALFN